MSGNLDLNRLRDTLRSNERTGDVLPERPSQKVLVDREGRVRFGDEVADGARDQYSVVPQNIFAGVLDALFGSSTAGSERHQRDRLTVREYLPSNTREVVQGELPLFMYDVIDEFGELYELAAYFDGDEYQVKLVWPELEEVFSVTEGHVFSDGRLCLRPPGNGMPRLKDAYARSVILVNGLTVLRRGGEFPFPSHA